MNALVIDLKRDDDIMVPAPWPIGIDADNKVTSGLGNDDGAILIGFAKAGEQGLTHYTEDIDAIDWDAEELVPVFSKDGGFFNWNIPVRGIRKIEVAVVTDPVFNLSIRLSNSAMLTPNDIAGALERLADDMRNHTAGAPHEEILEVPETTTIAGNVRDGNGHMVGNWSIKETAR